VRREKRGRGQSHFLRWRREGAGAVKVR